MRSITKEAVLVRPLPHDLDPDEYRPNWKVGGWRLPIPGEEYGRARAFALSLGATTEQLKQSELLDQEGLSAKSTAAALCGLHGKRMDCTRTDPKPCPGKFFRRFFCGERFCKICSPRFLRKAMTHKSEDAAPISRRLNDEVTMVAQNLAITFFIPAGEGPLTRETVRKFHSDLGKFWRSLQCEFEISNKQFGWTGADFVDLDRKTLGRTVAYTGPWLLRKEKALLARWQELAGERAHFYVEFVKEFAEAAKQIAKCQEKTVAALSTPKRRAELEIAFHGSRSISSGGAFYTKKTVREPGEDSPEEEKGAPEAKRKPARPPCGCPICGAPLKTIGEWTPISELEAEDRVDVDEARRKIIFARVPPQRSP